jgi:cobalamin biosynthetic protein CobC
VASVDIPALKAAADSTPAPRPAAPPLAHGGSLARARLLFPGAPEPLLDLSTGINPVPYPLSPLPPECLTRLPEPASVIALEAAAAASCGARDAACVAAAPGTQILIDLIPRLWPLPSVTVLGPTYAEHAAAWARAGARVATVGGFEDVGAASGVALCNPNNPDGRRVPPEELAALADRLSARGGLLVVDEAFADLEDGISVAGALPHPALIVLRSFGKTYGLAGVRLGFALASPARACAIRAALGPWAVSGPAIEAGRAALADPAWRDAAARRLAADAGALDDVLRGAGLRVVGGTRLFRLAEADDAQAVFERLGRAGILVRRFDDQPGRLRFGIPPDAAARRRLCDALG